MQEHRVAVGEGRGVDRDAVVGAAPRREVQLPRLARHPLDLRQPEPIQRILIWITQLAGTDQHHQSAFDELTFIASSR